jgi:hypothetical protein
MLLIAIEAGDEEIILNWVLGKYIVRMELSNIWVVLPEN